MHRYFLLLPLPFFLMLSNPGGAQSPTEIVRSMFTSTKQIKTLTYEMSKLERIRGDLKKQVATVKLSRDPYKVYTRQKLPDEGVEVLYIGGEKTALINPNGFPWINLRLSPHGKVMRKDQHHTILDAGFDRVVAILEHLFVKYESEIESLTSFSPSAPDDDGSYWVVEFRNPYYKYIEYKVKKGETVMSLAEKLKLNGYMILHLNKEVDDYHDLSEGQVIKIPNDYSPKMVLYIDKETMVPMNMKIFDEKGLYEQYEYKNVRINPILREEEFTSGYEAYGF